MSNGYSALELQESDLRKIIAAKMHVGALNSNYQMDQYIYGKGPSCNIFDAKKMWEKLTLAARAIAAIENPADVCVISGKPTGQRAILKFAKFTNSSSVGGRFSPGCFTNHHQAGFKEPRLLVITDPRVDHQAVREASYVNIPVIALCDADTDLKYIDIAIPCNNKGTQAVGLAWWFLSREVLRLRGSIPRTSDWSETVMPDLFFYRDPEEVKRQEEDEKKAAEEALNNAAEPVEAGGQDFQADEWEAQDSNIVPEAAAPVADDWAAVAPVAPTQQDWSSENVVTTGGDWAATETSQWA